MLFQKFVAQQLSRPAGLFGRLFTARWLEKANAGMNALTLDGLDLGHTDRLLEIGFGSGYLLEKAIGKDLCGYAAGVDVSQEMVRYVSGRLRRYIKDGKADIRFGDIESLPFATGEFTKACSVNTLYFWRDPRIALAECRRVLQFGGRLALCFNAKADLEKWPGHVHGFSLYELFEVEEMFTAAGFSEIATVSEIDPAQGLFHCVTGIAA